MKKKSVLIVLIVIVFCFNINAQNVGIGTYTPQNSALLDLNSANKGFLPPRLTSMQRKAIVDPATGLMVFDTDKSCLFLFDGVEWKPLIFATQDDVPPITRQANDPADNLFGNAVAISGDYAIVGAYKDDTAKGAAYIFYRNGGSWVQQAKLTASNGAPGDEFGKSVSISTNHVVIGAPGKDVFNVINRVNQGAAYVFVRNGSSWTQQQILYSSDGATSDVFGTAVTVYFSYMIAVGAPGHDVSGKNAQGAVYVFNLNGSTWTQQAILTANDGNEGDILGSSVSMMTSYVIAGAPGDDIAFNENQGSAYVFVQGGGTWTQQEKFTADDGEAQDEFGASVSIAGVYAVVGAPGDDMNGYDEKGSAHLFIHYQGGWQFSRKFTDPDGETWDWFGRSVVLTNDHLIIGSPGCNNGTLELRGAAFVYNSSQWKLIRKIIDPRGYNQANMGYSVGISGSNAIVGSPGFFGNGYFGKVFFYNLE